MSYIDEMEHKIFEKPALYLGKASLSLLGAFMSGYIERNYELLGESSSVKSSFNNEFTKFVNQYYEVDIETTKSPISIILEHCISEEEAFYKYYELCALFKS